MARSGEIDYVKNIGAAGRAHALNKPFSDANCGFYLRDLGTIMSLLPPAPARLLDLGCGTGWTSCFFALRGYAVTAQDIAEDMIALARENATRYAAPGLVALACDYGAMGFRDEFDCAVFYDSLHHAEDEKAALSATHAALKPGGILVTAEPGSGHGDSPDSRRAVETYGVTERDMPPRLIIEAGRRAGFRDFRLYARHFAPVEIAPLLSVRGARSLLRVLVREHWFRRALGKSHFVVMRK